MGEVQNQKKEQKRHCPLHCQKFTQKALSTDFAQNCQNQDNSEIFQEKVGEEIL
jgi:hypothetical protein